MSVLREILESPLSEAIGWTILHSVWQAGMIGLVALVLIKTRQNSTANYRYSVSILSLFAIFLSSALTFFIIYQSSGGAASDIAEKILNFKTKIKIEEGLEKVIGDLK